MKKPIKKLHLNRETIHSLDSSELSQIHGARIPDSIKTICPTCTTL